MLINTIKQYHGTPFQWGTFDCALFVANVLQDIHGVDYAAELRGQYNSELGSHRVLKKYGGLKGFLNNKFQQVNVRFAQRGDIIMLPPRTVGVCTGRRVACVSENDGIVYMPMSEAVAAWHVKR